MGNDNAKPMANDPATTLEVVVFNATPIKPGELIRGEVILTTPKSRPKATLHLAIKFYFGGAGLSCKDRQDEDPIEISVSPGENRYPFAVMPLLMLGPADSAILEADIEGKRGWYRIQDGQE